MSIIYKYITIQISKYFGIVMAFGRLFGGYISSHYAKKIGNVWIRRGFIAIVLIMAAVCPLSGFM